MIGYVLNAWLMVCLFIGSGNYVCVSLVAFGCWFVVYWLVVLALLVGYACLLCLFVMFIVYYLIRLVLM